MNPALVVAGTEIARAAIELLKDWRKQRSERVEPGATVEQRLQSLASRLDSLEATETSQTELLKSMAEQLKALSIAQAESARKLNLALGLTLAALLAAFTGIALWITR